MLTDDLLAYIRCSLPEPPGRVLEVGAGEGELAAWLRELGHELVAIDPDPRGPGVEPVSLAELEAEPESFDAAVAVVSLHHVEPLGESLGRLAEVLRPGGRFVIDEFDASRVDERAASWWMAQRQAARLHVPESAAAMLEALSGLHSADRIRKALSGWFEVGEPVRGPYMHRWELPPGLRPLEEAAMAAGELPATGARLIAIRR